MFGYPKDVEKFHGHHHPRSHLYLPTTPPLVSDVVANNERAILDTGTSLIAGPAGEFVHSLFVLVAETKEHTCTHSFSSTHTHSLFPGVNFFNFVLCLPADAVNKILSRFSGRVISCANYRSDLPEIQIQLGGKDFTLHPDDYVLRVCMPAPFSHDETDVVFPPSLSLSGMKKRFHTAHLCDWPCVDMDTRCRVLIPFLVLPSCALLSPTRQQESGVPSASCP